MMICKRDQWHPQLHGIAELHYIYISNFPSVFFVEINTGAIVLPVLQL